MTPQFCFNIEELNCVYEFVYYAGKNLAIVFVFLKPVNLMCNKELHRCYHFLTKSSFLKS